MKIIKTYEYYTGIESENIDIIELSTQAKRSEIINNYSLLIQGLLKFVEMAPNIKKEDKLLTSGEENTYCIYNIDNIKQMVVKQSASSQYNDTKKCVTKYNYNPKLQNSEIVTTEVELNVSNKSFENELKTKQFIIYLWEIEVEAKVFAPSLIRSNIGLTIIDGVTYINNKIEYNYIKKKISDTECHYSYDSSIKCDNIDSGLETKRNQVYYDTQGRLMYIVGVEPNNNSSGLTTSNQYTEHTNLVVAQFDNICINDSLKKNAHYLNIDIYTDEKYSIDNNHTFSSEYFIITESSIVDIGFLNQKGILLNKNSLIKRTNDLIVRKDKNYIVSFWMKVNNGNWEYVQKLINGATLVTNDILYTMIENATVCHIMIRESECIASVNIYDPDDMRLIANIDNNGIPSIIQTDSLNRPILSYKHKLESVSSEVYDKYKLSDDVVLNSMSCKGFSRFNGFSSGNISIVPEKLQVDSEINFSFPETCKILQVSGGEYNNLSTTSLFATCPNTINGQNIIINCGYILKVQLQHNTVKLFIDNVIVKSSEQYIQVSSSWQIFIINKFIGIIADGKLIISYVTTNDNSIKSVNTEIGSSYNGVISSAIVFVTPKVLCTNNYFDYAGNLIQTQVLRGDRLLINQNFYDKKSNLTVKTENAFYPLSNDKIKTSDNVFEYRNNFADITFLDDKVTISGELNNFYLSTQGKSYCQNEGDELNPYEKYIYEDDARNRCIACVSAGKMGQDIAHTYSYNDSESNAIMSEFKTEDDVSCGSNKYNANISGNNYTQGIYSISDANNNQLVHKLYGKAVINNTVNEMSRTFGKENKLLVDSGIMKFQSDIYAYFDNSIASKYKTYTGIYGRIVGAFDENVEKAILYDSIGNSRLAYSGTTTWKYSKYDIKDRIIETGLFISQRSDLFNTFATDVNNPNFPEIKDGTVTPMYKFKYDLDDINSPFSLGRLIEVDDVNNNIITKYNYDSLGKISSYQYHMKDKGRNFEEIRYSYDCLDNIVQITYPSGVIINYEYNNFGKVHKILYRRSIKHNSKIILINPIYDLYDNLALYTQANSFIAIKNWGMNKDLSYIGTGDFSINIEKFHKDNIDVKKLTGFYINSIDNGRYTRILNYDILGELSVSSDEKLTTSMEYDNEGNLDTIKYLNLDSRDSETIKFNYLNGKISEAQSDTRGLLHKFEYNEVNYLTEWKDIAGNLQYKSKADMYYDKKVSVITKSDIGTSQNYTQLYDYDYMGNMQSSTTNKIAYKIYLYGYAGRVECKKYNYKSPDLEKTIYIYCEDELICEYNPGEDIATNLIYDKSNTLVIANDPIGTYTDYDSILFGEVNKLKSKDITFHYQGMNYLKDFDFYEDDGKLYFPKYGFTNVKDVSNFTAFTSSYRKNFNCPLL